MYEYKLTPLTQKDITSINSWSYCDEHGSLVSGGQISALTTTSIGSLTTASIGALSSINPSISSLTSGWDACGSRNSMVVNGGYLTTASISALTSVDIGSLTTSMITSLTTTPTLNYKPIDVNILTAENVSKLTVKDIEISAKPEVKISTLNPYDISMFSLTPMSPTKITSVDFDFSKYTITPLDSKYTIRPLDMTTLTTLTMPVILSVMPLFSTDVLKYYDGKKSVALNTTGSVEIIGDDVISAFTDKLWDTVFSENKNHYIKEIHVGDGSVDKFEILPKSNDFIIKYTANRGHSITLNCDGTVTYDGKFTPNDNSVIFWNAIYTSFHDRLNKKLQEVNM